MAICPHWDCANSDGVWLKRAQVVIEHWRNHYNTQRPHSALGYRPPAPEVVLPREKNATMETGQMAA